MTYTSNGRLQTLTDAEGNMTTYEYDGFDRLARDLPGSEPDASFTCDLLSRRNSGDMIPNSFQQ